jgi:hypothetical protein
MRQEAGEVDIAEAGRWRENVELGNDDGTLHVHDYVGCCKMGQWAEFQTINLGLSLHCFCEAQHMVLPFFFSVERVGTTSNLLHSIIINLLMG